MGHPPRQTADASPADSDLVEPRLQPPVRFQEQLKLAQVSLMPFRVRVHGGHLVGKSLRHVKAVEDANADPADLTWLIFGGFGREVPVD
jgi:hypothetical protein